MTYFSDLVHEGIVSTISRSEDDLLRYIEYAEADMKESRTLITFAAVFLLGVLIADIVINGFVVPDTFVPIFCFGLVAVLLPIAMKKERQVHEERINDAKERMKQ